MKKIYSTLTITILSILFLVSGLIVAQQSGSQQQPTATQAQDQQSLKTFEGELSKVDNNAKRLWVKGSDGKEMVFQYNEQTQISGAGGSVEGLATMNGAHVIVTYDESSMTASSIQVLPNEEK